MTKIRNEGRLRIGTLLTCEEQCRWPECDSWKTLMFSVVGFYKGDPVEADYPLCQKHLFEFIDKYVFGSDTNIVMRRDGTVEE